MDNREVPEGVDPTEFLRALLHISPEDAEKARQDSPAPGEREDTTDPTGDPDKG